MLALLLSLLPSLLAPAGPSSAAPLGGAAERVEHEARLAAELRSRELLRILDGETTPIERPLPDWSLGRELMLAWSAGPSGLRIEAASWEERRRSGSRDEVQRASSQLVGERLAGGSRGAWLEGPGAAEGPSGAEGGAPGEQPHDEPAERPAESRSEGDAQTGKSLLVLDPELAALVTPPEEGVTAWTLPADHLGPLLFPGPRLGLCAAPPAGEESGRGELLRELDERHAGLRASLEGSCELSLLEATEEKRLLGLEAELRCRSLAREEILAPGGSAEVLGDASRLEEHRYILEGRLEVQWTEAGWRLQELELSGPARLLVEDVRTVASPRGELETLRLHTFEGRYELRRSRSDVPPAEEEPAPEEAAPEEAAPEEAGTEERSQGGQQS